MGKGSRLRAERASLPPFRSADDAMRAIRMGGFRPGVEVASFPGACLADEVAAVRKETHDRLISWLGRRRRSGIWWLVIEGSGECSDKLALMYAPEEQDAETEAGLLRMYEYFDEHGEQARLVVAQCEAMA